MEDSDRCLDIVIVLMTSATPLIVPEEETAPIGTTLPAILYRRVARNSTNFTRTGTGTARYAKVTFRFAMGDGPWGSLRYTAAS